jgi:tetratricopeptide (TPR) repeat protein
MRAQFFTPEGGFLPAALFLAALLPISISSALQQKDVLKKALLAVSTIVIILGLAISVFNLLPGKQFAARFPSFSNDWSIAVDALKDSPLFGVGPGNYLTAFNLFRPMVYNNTDLWAIKFTTSRSFYLTLLTETGMLGAAGIILLILSLYRNLKTDFKEKRLVKWGSPFNPNTISLLLLLLLLVFFPATLLLYTAVFIILATVTKTSLTTLNLKAQGADESQSRVASRLPAMLIGLPVILAVLVFDYQASRVLAAEYTFRRAVNALAKNEAQLTYDLMISAINLNPRVDRYHSTYSQVNLALANSIAGGENITDQDRTSIAQLVQQAIREAKAAVALNLVRAGNWLVLARTYQAIMPLAQGADLFAVQTYSQAVALDRFNPNIRIALGGVHYARGDYDTAIRVFELATATKPDHANAHYNLAFALRDKGELDRAINEMTLVLSLLDRTTNDYEVARQALEDLQEKRAEAPVGEELTPPQGPEAPVLEPPLELPEESEPPEPPLTPTPTPTPEAEAEGEEGEEGEAAESPTITPQVTPTPTPTP